LAEDREILRSIASGDRTVFSIFYTRYAQKVYNTALSYSKNVVEAEEITQDVFIKIYQKASTFKGKSSVNTWVYRIAVNTSLNYTKKKQRLTLLKKEHEYAGDTDFQHPGALLENKENAATLFKVMDHLPPNQKIAFILSFIEDLPRQEVADIMEISLKATESLLQRAKKSMRIELEKIYPHRRISEKGLSK